MKKLFPYILSVLSAGTILFSASCSKILDQGNLGAYDSTQIWNDRNLANAYLANIYSVFGNYNVGADALSDQLSGTSFANPITTTSAGPLSTWSYTSVRLINQGITSIQTGMLSQDDKKFILGQLYFLRAYTYFPMVITYGGVPYLKVAQGRSDSLNVPRNSTKECFDFMLQDLDSALALLPTRILSSSSTDYGKVDGNFALAFRAKVLLYEASPQFNPSNPWDNALWTSAYTATKLAYDNLKTQGYQLIADYSQIARLAGNSEVVFCVQNKLPNKTAGWDNGIRPGTLSRGPASACPTWEMIKSFPMLDGKAYNDPSGSYYQSDAGFLQDYWKNRDPRFVKSIVWNGVLYPVAGTPTGYRQYTSLGIADPLDAFGINPNAGVPVSARNGVYTGFFILKNSDLSLTQAQVGNYAINYNVMRFAEVMLNYAEAANETGHLQDALDILKQIRSRAGIQAGSDGNYGLGAATTRILVRQAIMNERNIELCFEGFRFNDLRRWRMFNVLDGVYKHGIEAIAINANGSEMPIVQAKSLASTYQLTESNFKYTDPIIVPTTGVNVNKVPGTYYFAPIPLSVIAAGSSLQQNKDWGGTFDPTLH